MRSVLMRLIHSASQGKASQAKSNKKSKKARKKAKFSHPIFQNFSWGLNQHILIPSFLLLVLGLIGVFSASSYRSLQETGYESATTYIVRQVVFAFIGTVVGLVTYRFKPDYFRKPKFRSGLLLVMTVLLLVVRFLMPAINGAKGWIILGPISIQPVEFLKPVMILLWADYLDRHRLAILNKGFFKTVKANLVLPLALFFWLGLVLTFPDTGGVLLLGLILGGMTLASGISSKYTLRTLGLGALAYVLVIGLLNLFDFSGSGDVNYRIQRFISFTDPFKVAKTSGLQLVNSFYALAMGGLLGQGPGNSIQKTGYLPEAHTDFIMAIIGEEYGFIGLFVILALYFYLTFYIFYRAKKIQNNFYQLVMIGVGFYFLSQAIVNLGGITGLIPITGVTFPFISYGGSSIMTTGIMVGLALAIDYRNRRMMLAQQFS
ncbi:FtsW/RodA/SpoVE family cell cycle protein [Aerococcus tenax]|nr:FtsW/RodA/SpoVE family cell cycle protein [Aerococcus tenax]RAV93177.1 FtsW/RodA/SpoVE family cell cycle protein [Aerococcus tenax]